MLWAQGRMKGALPFTAGPLPEDPFRCMLCLVSRLEKVPFCFALGLASSSAPFATPLPSVSGAAAAGAMTASSSSLNSRHMHVTTGVHNRPAGHFEDLQTG